MMKFGRIFFPKLSRAGSQRDQYVAIQALILARIEPETCLELVEIYFQSQKDDFDEVKALLARAEAYETLRHFDRCVDCYKSVLAREAEFPNHRTNTSVWLPYLIACENLQSEYDFALDLLNARAGDLALPIDLFRWNASKALILQALERNDEAKYHATSAVEAANIRKSGFRYHQDLGLVGDADRSVVKKMYQLAA